MIQKFVDFAKNTAIQAGYILKEGFETDFKVKEKEGKNNLVTEFDHKSENFIISRIKEEFPDHQILAEESGYSDRIKSNTPLWIIDPLDGTVNFARGIPIYCVSIGLQVDGEIVAGAIYHPELNEIYYAGKGIGAFCNGERIFVSQRDDFKRSLLVTGFPYNVHENPGKTLETFINIVGKGIPVRRLGSAALDMAYVAKGRFEGFWEIDLKPWDVAAGIIILKEADGSILNYSGNTFNFEDRSIVATNGKIENELLASIQEIYEN